MNCEDVTELLADPAAFTASTTEREAIERHAAYCPDCRDLLHGYSALALLRDQPSAVPPRGLYNRLVSAGVSASMPWRERRGFWLGTGFGSAIAASAFAAALALGWLSPRIDSGPVAAEFEMSLGETRNMNIAIETARPLTGARISILLSGAIELDGYAGRRELTWSTDLEAGVNRLSLPVIASTPAGGQLVVRLSHPDSEQLFVVRLKTLT